ncbi:MAG: hypothetical protein PHU14_15190 [Methylovulum sp.]|nr:hypothetical protein [Methylovulum sp.]
MAICAVISGAEGWGAIETFGQGEMALGRRHCLCSLAEVKPFAHAVRARCTLGA